ncbi:tetratricopeptide repeat protein [Portibacter marinus]|uniref:tetratricopeptide repeat protein n=1 Tax=Portibacter marinus TaxID=2898660 RepID=UPI001F254F5B|nr:tetratricopeptide repeat protein [Portibacter marinus]
MGFHLRLLSIFFFCLTAPLSSARDKNKIDSLIAILESDNDTILLNTYEELFLLELPNEPTKAKPYLDQAFEVLKRIESPARQARWIKNLGIYYYYIADYEEASKTLYESSYLFEALGDKDQLSKVYNNLGVILKYMGEPEKSLEAHLNSLKIKEELKQKGYAIAASYLNIGNIYGELQDLDKSNKYYLLAENIFIDDQDEYRLSIVRSNLAVNMEVAGKVDKALDYYMKSLPYFINNGHKIEEAKQYNLIGALYQGIDSLEQAERYFTKAKQMGKQLQEKQIEELATRNLGDIYFQQMRYNEALSHFKRALELSTESGTETRRINTYLRLAEAYAALGNYEQAYEFRMLHFNQYDQVFQKERMDNLHKLEIQFQTEKKEQQIALQEKEIQLLVRQARLNTFKRVAISLAFLLSLLGIYALLQRKKRDQLEKEKVDIELKLKNQELENNKRALTTHALNLARKNETLENLKIKAKKVKTLENQEIGLDQMVRAIDLDLNSDESWEQFSTYFDSVHQGFNAKAMSIYPEIKPNDLRLMALIMLNISTKEVAQILNISISGVKKARQRLRKKMSLNTSDSLEQAVIEIKKI